MKAETKLVLVFLAIWFCGALAVGLTGVFSSASALAVALTVWTLTAVVLLSCWKIPVSNQWARTVDISALIALHLTRFVGAYFLVLCENHELSCRFARPAGIGDIATATGAVILLIWAVVRDAPTPRSAILIWNTFGLLDILFVVFNAFRVSLIDWQGMAPLRTLPLMLLPTFLVPLIIASHLIIFTRMIKWRDAKRG